MCLLDGFFKYGCEGGRFKLFFFKLFVGSGLER